MELCEQVLACFSDDEDFRRAVIDTITNDPYFIERMQTLINNGSIITTPTTPIVSTDDLDALFGAITYLVDTMNGANIDLYEALEASTNNRENGQIMFEAIPVFETLPFDEASEYIDFIASSVAENYASEYTTTPLTGMRDRIRCGLFCLARDNGNALTWELIAQYFWDQISFTTSDYLTAFVDFVGFITTGSWSGEEIVFISFGNIAAALSQTQKFAEMTFPSLSGIMALGQNDPDPDWLILCTDCPPPPPENCEDPAKFTIGNVTSQAGLEFTVQGVYHPVSGYYRIEWGTSDCSEEPCYGFSYEFLSGALNTAEIIGEGCVNIGLASLPQDVYWFYFAAPAPFTMKITFGE